MRFSLCIFSTAGTEVYVYSVPGCVSFNEFGDAGTHLDQEVTSWISLFQTATVANVVKPSTFKPDWMSGQASLAVYETREGFANIHRAQAINSACDRERDRAVQIRRNLWTTKSGIKSSGLIRRRKLDGNGRRRTNLLIRQRRSFREMVIVVKLSLQSGKPEELIGMNQQTHLCMLHGWLYETHLSLM